MQQGPVLCRFLDAGNEEGPHAQLTGVQKAPRHEVAGSRRRPGSECYGDLMLAPSWMIEVTAAGFDLRLSAYGRSAECGRHFGG